MAAACRHEHRGDCDRHAERLRDVVRRRERVARSGYTRSARSCETLMPVTRTVRAELRTNWSEGDGGG